ncbi:helix-turn-helix domain-containing protein [Bradyrhizobium sp. STM 3843]|uniref:helix-turn-helix domain-containing protein n=1 Tax=Bradyrhizobium sp. STM 3843 TaxID=551947 RepID=UPI0009FCC432|nr:helix-turn-helix domain-containing protein [Bradyrhizobium sp. STM 3843]
MNFVEYPIDVGAKASAEEETGILRCFRSPPPLSDILEAIWDCDIPNARFAKSLTIKCAPGTSLQLIGQYRRPAEIHQRAKILPAKCATHIQSHAVTLRPTGGLGVIIVSLRSDAASRIVQAPIRELANADLHLSDLFRAWEVAMCDEMLATAQTSEERVAGVQAFLLQHLRPHTDSLANRAACYLRRNPTIQMSSLAARLGTSSRNLSRAFSAAFGLSPKRFARLARFQKILAERRRSRSWAQTAYACGLTDQAHLIDEFHDLVGEAPTDFFAHELSVGASGMDEANLIIQRAAPVARPITVP